MSGRAPDPPGSWTPPACRTVVVVPHPDDEVLAAGGLILRQRSRGVPTVVVAVTDGDAAYPTWDGDLAAVRRNEQRAALAVLGVDSASVVRLSLPDGCLHAHETELTARLRELVRKDDLLVAPWVHDRHGDHEACGRAARAAAGDVGCGLVGSVVWGWGDVETDDWHELEVLRLGLDQAEVDLRWAAMECHRTQLDPPGIQPIVDDDLLEILRRPTETYVRYLR